MEGDPKTEGLEAPLLRTSNDAEQQCAYESLSIDNMLSKYVGDFGLAQLVHFVVVSLAWCLEGLHTLVMIFADREPEWQCRPSLDPNSCTPASSLCSLDPTLWEWVGGKSTSTVSQWNLICGEEYKVGLAQATFFIGAFMGKAKSQHEMVQVVSMRWFKLGA
jgi:OCT family organic cation transporter-like MFS transporter 4/5